jgi:ribosomal protein S18 acetylase RimI-like enzyme
MLQQRGFTLKAQGSVLIFEPEADFEMPTLAEEVQVQRVDEARREDFVETVCEGFELRGGFWRAWEAISRASVGHPQQVSYLAYVNNKPTGGASLFFSKDGRSAVLYATATLPEYRHHGVQTALIQAALSEAKNRNVSTLLGHTPSDSNAQHNLERNGFRIAYLRDNYQLGLEYK